MEQMAHIDARIPLSVRETIDLAASLEGRTPTDFIIEAVAGKARQVIAEHAVVQLSLRDQQMLAAALADDTVREPDAFLESIAAEYRIATRARRGE